MFGIETYANENLYFLLFGVLGLIAIYVWSHHRRQARVAAFAHVESMKKIADAISMRKRIVKRVMLCLAYLLIVFAVMRPQGNPDQRVNPPEDKEAEKQVSSGISLQDVKAKDEDGKTITVRDSARDVIFLLDVSASMGAEDLYPNRLEKAKDMIRDTVDAFESEHVGLVVFTSVPSVKCVLTLDYAYFKQALNAVTINDNDFAGTKFTPALEEIVDRQFDFSDNKFKELVIITDGGDTDLEVLEGADKTNFEQAIYDLSKRAREDKGIRIHSIGLGTRAGAVVQGVKDENGNPVKSGINEALLQGISKNANGIYVSASNGNVDMTQIYTTKIASVKDRDLQQESETTVDEEKLKELVQKQRQTQEEKVVYEELYTYPIFIAVLLLIGELILGDRKRAPRRKSEEAA